MNHKWLKRLGVLLGAIVLGAIGSGVWAEFLCPVWNALTGGVVQLFAALSDSFKNSVYSEAAKGFHEIPSLSLLLLLLAMFCGLYLSLLWAGALSRLEKAREVFEQFLWSKHNFIAFAFLVLVFITTVVFVSIKLTYVNRVATSSLNSIDIVSPYVGIQKTLQLRSDFHTIKTSDDYRQFYQKMKALQEEHKVASTLFEPL